MFMPAQAHKLLPEDDYKPFTFTSDLPVECPKACDGNTAILVAAGQSNLTDSVSGKYFPKGNIIQFNPYDGKCYKYSSELPLSSVTTRVAEKLIEQGPYDTVVVANFAIGGTDTKLWAPGKLPFERLKTGLALLARMKLRPTYFIWELGETDTNYKTSPDDFSKGLQSTFDGLRKAGYNGPIYVAKSTRCLMRPGCQSYKNLSTSADKIRAAQSDVIDIPKGIFPGPDTDVIQGNGRDWFQCHFSAVGADLAAQLWVDSILGQPKEKIQGEIHIDREHHTAWNLATSCVVATMEFHPWILSHEINGSNNFVGHRTEIFKTGGRLEEDIVTYNYDQHLVETRSTNVVVPSLPVRRLWTRMELKADGEKGSVFEWTLYYDPARGVNRRTVAKKVQAFLDSGLFSIKKVMEETP